MRNAILVIVIVSIAILSSNCKSNLNEQISSNTQDTASIKAEIERILKVQEDAYAQHNEEGNRIMQSTCVDSLMYVNDGGITISAYFYAHDLSNGWIERPHDKKFQFYNNIVFVSSIHKSYYLLGADTIFNKNRMTKVFIRDNNQWKMAGVYYSPLQVNYFKKGHGNPAFYHDYVGVYQIEPAIADTILLINGNLYVRRTTESVKIKLFPVNDSTFMAEGYLEKMIFGKGISGKVKEYTLEFYDGQRVHIPKVN